MARAIGTASRPVRVVRIYDGQVMADPGDGGTRGEYRGQGSDLVARPRVQENETRTNTVDSYVY